MNVSEQLSNIGLIPVAVIDDAAKAAPAVTAMAEGGIGAIEITLRTAAGLEAIRRTALECSKSIVGAGTVTNLDDEKRCIDLGAKFIVSPGFNREMVEWSFKNDVLIIPGCVTPTEIMEAMSLGLKVLKFFPSSVYGGIPAMKALSGPFPGIKFIPTGGVNAKNLAEYIAAPFIHAVGGSWVCTKADIAAENYDYITKLCREATNTICSSKANLC